MERDIIPENPNFLNISMHAMYGATFIIIYNQTNASEEHI